MVFEVQTLSGHYSSWSVDIFMNICLYQSLLQSNPSRVHVRTCILLIKHMYFFILCDVTYYYGNSSLDIQLSERPSIQDEDRVQIAARSVREKKNQHFPLNSCAICVYRLHCNWLKESEID